MMKKLILIACLFALINCYITNMGALAPFPTRKDAVNCNSTNPVTGCAECVQIEDQFQCNKAADGYFIEPSDDLVYSCLRQCKTCDDNTTCSSCNEGANLKDSSCLDCQTGYTLDMSGVDADDAVCISQYFDTNYSCNTGFKWDRTPNSGRMCVSNKNTTCQTGYLFNDNSGQCDFCNDGYTYAVTNIESKQLECVEYAVPDLRPVANQTRDCQETDETNPKICKVANPGYYVDQGNVKACPNQCGSCALSTENNTLTCSACRTEDDRYILSDGNCTCADGFTPDRQNTTTMNGFTCVQIEFSPDTQNKMDLCTPGNVWSTQYTSNENRTCVSVEYGNCYNEKDSPSNSYWDETQQNGRDCILAAYQQCNYYYSQSSKDKSNFYNTSLTANCDSCVSGYSISNSAGQKKCVKTPTSSQFLQVTLFAILSLLVFLF